METVRLGCSDLVVSRLAYGCMRVSGTWDPSAVTPERREAGLKALHTALDAGINCFDHADIYGRGTCETLFGDFLAQSPGLRDKVIIATKCGVRFRGEPNPDSPGRYDFSAEHIIRSCEQSLQRLQTETIDLYQLHRPDLLMHPQEVADAFEQLHSQGKVRWFGVSNFKPSTLALLSHSLAKPLIVNQIEMHLAHLDPLFDGTLDQCMQEGMTPLIWSPLGGGFLGDGATVRPDDPQRRRKIAIQVELDAVAAEIGCSRSQAALAWLQAHPCCPVPIIGTVNPARIAHQAQAASISLSREQWYRLVIASQGKPMP